MLILIRIYGSTFDVPTCVFCFVFLDQASALQRHVDSLESQLEEQEAEATRAIQVWEEQVNEAEEDNKLLSIELENVRASTAELIELRDALSQGGERYTQMKGKRTKSQSKWFFLEFVSPVVGSPSRTSG